MGFWFSAEGAEGTPWPLAPDTEGKLVALRNSMLTPELCLLLPVGIDRTLELISK